jgi:hypothetical protein
VGLAEHAAAGLQLFAEQIQRLYALALRPQKKLKMEEDVKSP